MCHLESQHVLIRPPRHNSDSTSETHKSSTIASTSTKVTSTGSSSGGDANNHGQATGNPNPRSTFPPPDPLTDGFGAQFANQIPPLPTPEQQAIHRHTRMMEFHNAFAGLGVYLPWDVLIRVENAHYGVLAPDTVLAQLAARHHHIDPRAQWEEAEDIWNTETGRIRARWPEMGRLVGWEDLEELPAQR